MWVIVEIDEGRQVTALRIPLGKLIVGSGGQCDLVLKGKRISRKHLSIERIGEDLSFEDLGSSYGVKINGAKAKAGRIKTGDELSLADAILRFVNELPKTPLSQGKTNEAAGKDFGPKKSADWRPFNELLDKIKKSGETKELLQSLLMGLLSLFGARRGLILLIAEERKLSRVMCVPSDCRENLVAASRTICNKSLDSGKLVYIPDTTVDLLCQDALSIKMYDKGHWVICAPLSFGNHCFGVIYLDGENMSNSVSQEQLDFFLNVTGLSAGLIAGQETRKQLLRAKGKIRNLTILSKTADDLVFGDGQATKDLQDLIGSAAPVDVSVLITGETGTGKEMVARKLHEESARRNSPFVPVNCGALNPDLVEAEFFGAEKGAYTGAIERRIGKFELATGGTLFLDEVGELPLPAQTALLRVLQERTMTRVGGNEKVDLDFRLICATNRDLEEEVKASTFRQDLYFRINVFRITLLPLRNRKEDIMPLANHFLESFGARFSRKIAKFNQQAEELLLSYEWPGNIRELKNAIERAVVVAKGREIEKHDLPIATSNSNANIGDSHEAVEFLLDTLPNEYEKARDFFDTAFLQRCLNECDNNVAKMARRTGMSRQAIYRRLTALGLVKDE